MASVSRFNSTRSGQDLTLLSPAWRRWQTRKGRHPPLIASDRRPHVVTGTSSTATLQPPGPRTHPLPAAIRNAASCKVTSGPNSWFIRHFVTVSCLSQTRQKTLHSAAKYEPIVVAAGSNDMRRHHQGEALWNVVIAVLKKSMIDS